MDGGWIDENECYGLMAAYSNQVNIIIIAGFYSLTNVAMLLLGSGSNSYSLLVGSACLRKQTGITHAAAWK